MCEVNAQMERQNLQLIEQLKELRFCNICKENKPRFEFYYGNQHRCSKDEINGGFKCKKCADKMAEDKRLEEERTKLEKDKMTKNFIKQFENGYSWCTGCGKFEPFDQFTIDKNTSDGYNSRCKKMIVETKVNYKDQSENRKKWRQNNLERSREISNNWEKRKKKEDPSYKLQRNIKNTICASIRNYNEFHNDKKEKFEEALFKYLPYTPEQLTAHLESLWEPWMNWDNYGKYDKNRPTWQIDHIYPQSKLPFINFTDLNFLLCWSLRNLSPLETAKNIKKRNHIPSNPWDLETAELFDF